MRLNVGGVVGGWVGGFSVVGSWRRRQSKEIFEYLGKFLARATEHRSS